MVHDIHNRIENNFELIQHTINVLIELITIVLSILVGLVMRILIGLLRMERNVKMMRDNRTVLRARSVEGFYQQKSDQYFSKSYEVSEL